MTKDNSVSVHCSVFALISVVGITPSSTAADNKVVYHSGLVLV